MRRVGTDSYNLRNLLCSKFDGFASVRFGARIYGINYGIKKK